MAKGKLEKSESQGIDNIEKLYALGSRHYAHRPVQKGETKENPWQKLAMLFASPT